MKQLNILELHRTINEKNNRKNECYEKVLDIFHKKISIAAEHKNLRAFIEIPEYICGYPLYNLNDCIVFVMTSLKNNGFLVQYYFPKMLYISWDFEEIKRKDNETKTLPAPKQQLQLQQQSNNNLNQNLNNKTINMNNNMNNNTSLLTSKLLSSKPIASFNKKPTGKLALNMF